jgi:hypothetical protein
MVEMGRSMAHVAHQPGPVCLGASGARRPFPFPPFTTHHFQGHRPCSPGGVARGSHTHTGQFSCFGPRSSCLAHIFLLPKSFFTGGKKKIIAYGSEMCLTCRLVPCFSCTRAPWGHMGHTQRNFGSRSASGAQSTTPRRLPAYAGNLEELH